MKKQLVICDICNEDISQHEDKKESTAVSVSSNGSNDHLTRIADCCFVCWGILKSEVQMAIDRTLELRGQNENS